MIRRRDPSEFGTLAVRTDGNLARLISQINLNGVVRGFVSLKRLHGHRRMYRTGGARQLRLRQPEAKPDAGLLRYLRRHKHTTPSEMVELKFHCCMPIFIARQWIRHRTANVNEYSGRYSSIPMLFYTPEEAQLQTQSARNTQAVTLGPVIIMKAKFYDALFASANSAVTFEQFVADPAVCARYLEAVAILLHELVHVKQYRTLGRYNFTTQYVAKFLINKYPNIDFEHEAFNYAIMIDELQGGNFCAVMAPTDNLQIAVYGLSVAHNSCPNNGVYAKDFPPCP